MKILYGITKSNFGGAQRYVFDLACAAHAAGHDVAVLCGGEGMLVKKLEAEKIRHISIPGFGRDLDFKGDFMRLMFIIKTLRAEKPDVFHINSAKMGGAGIFAGRLVGVSKIIFTAHGWAFNEPRPFWQKWLITFFSWLTIFSAHLTICVSEKTRRDIASLPFIENKLVIIRNGIAPFPLLPRVEARRALGVHSEERLIVGTLAELHPVKGLDILLTAWEKFSRGREAELLIFGEGDARHHLEMMIQKLDLSSSVTLKGYVSDAKQYLSALDIFVLPSRSEGLPYTILEAGFASLPTIASAVGGIPEVIETGLNGVLVTPEHPEELFSTLLLLAEDKALRERLGQALRAEVETHFSLAQMARDTFALYR